MTTHSPTVRNPKPRTPRAIRSFEYWMYQYKRTWRSTVTSGLISPLLYLAAMGVGLGSLVDKHHSSQATLGGVSYVAFLAPGMLAAVAMQIATQESTYPVLAAVKWMRAYFAMLATPLRVVDVLVGHLLWITFRVTVTVLMFLGVMELFGAGHHWTVLLAVPAAVLTGMAFAVPIAAYAATRDGDAAFAAIFRFVVMPMFLFSGTFFPVTQLPLGFRVVAYATPLWHGVDMCRSLALGTASPGRIAVHVAYLGAIVAIGFVAARRSYTRRLAT
jgi:lipooligosaccharide transport system permease protein